MPRKYERTTNRQSWNEENMQKAIEAVKKRKMGWLAASKTFGVPQATLRRHAKETNKLLSPGCKGLGRLKIVSPSTIGEQELVQHITLLENCLFGFDCTDVQQLALQIANKHGYANSFINKESAEQEWLTDFQKRQEDLLLRNPEPTSAARAQALTRPQIACFYKIYQEVLDKYHISPDKIFNVDESGLSTVQRPQKALAKTGRKQVGALTSAKKDSNVTVVCCASAIGFFVPPCLIFPRKNMRNELVDDAPTGSLGVAQKSGCMTTDVFLKWLSHFQSYVHASKERKVLLIVNGHASHKGLECLEFAKANGIVLFYLPSHCTHHIQPLDVSFFGSLKTYFNREVSHWLRTHPGRVVTHYQISSLFNQAYGKAATVHNACSGFKNTGLWPVNPDICSISYGNSLPEQVSEIICTPDLS